MMRTVMLAGVLTLLVLFPVKAGGDLPAADDYRPLPATRDIWVPGSKPARKATLWVLRIEGEKREYLVPIRVMKEFGFKAGQTVSPETARLIAIEMGADYPPDILEKLK